LLQQALVLRQGF